MAGMKRKAFRQLSFSRTPKRTRTVAFRRRIVGPRPEVKYYQGSFSAAVSSVPNNLNVGLIAEGNDVNNRIGRRVTPKSLILKGQLLASVGALSDNWNQARLLLLRIRGKYSGTPLDYITGVMNMPLLDKCQVIWDQLYQLNKTTADVPIGIAINKRFKLNGAPISWSTGAAGDDTNNQIILVLVSDSSTIEHPTFNIVTRMFFTDH